METAIQGLGKEGMQKKIEATAEFRGVWVFRCRS